MPLQNHHEADVIC